MQSVKLNVRNLYLSFKSDAFCPVILRLSTVYGDSPRKRFDLVVNRFVLMALKKLKSNYMVKIHGDLLFQQMTCHVLLIKVLESEKKNCE